MQNPFFISKGPLKLSEIAEKLQCEIINLEIENKKEKDDDDQITQKCKDIEINSINTIKESKPNEITFLANTKYINYLKESNAGACIIATKEKDRVIKTLSENITRSKIQMLFLVCPNPYATYAKLLNILYEENSEPEKKTNIKNIDGAYIDESAEISSNCIIQHGAYIGYKSKIGRNCKIGVNSYIGPYVEIKDNVIIGSNVSITHSIIDDCCIIHNGARIGQDGFGFAPDDNGKIIKIMQLGRVIIEKNVEIGANTCIDRGSLSDTKIGENTKIDNLIQIAHNVEIGKNCFIASQVGISGSVKIGNGVMIGGQSGFTGHIIIGDNVRIAGKSGVINDVESNTDIAGFPAINTRQWHMQNVILKNLTIAASNKGKK